MIQNTDCILIDGHLFGEPTQVQFRIPPPIVEGQRLSVNLFSCLLPRVREYSC